LSSSFLAGLTKGSLRELSKSGRKYIYIYDGQLAVHVAFFVQKTLQEELVNPIKPIDTCLSLAVFAVLPA
jgi:hypothetical protein